MQNFISEVTLWMDWNKPKLYDDKTESILIKSDRIMLPDSAPTSIRVGSSDVPFVTHARNLGITISSNTTMDKHVTNICRSAYAELRRISSIRHLLAVSATKTLLSAFVLSKLDYCNSLLCGSPQFILDKLQRVQNSAARLVMKSCTGYQSAQRTDYKISTLCFNTFTNSSLVYIAQRLSIYTTSRHLSSSSDTRILRIPFFKTKSFGQKCILIHRPNSMEFTALWTPTFRIFCI